MRRSKKWLRIALPILTVLWIGFILSRSMKSGKDSSAESEFYYNLLHSVFPWITIFIVRKGAHFFEFFILGLLLYWDFRLLWRRSFWLPVLCGLLIAVADELLQRVIPERSGELADMLLDLSGVVTACLLAWLFCRLREKRRKRRE